jgi:hypothetical protein
MCTGQLGSEIHTRRAGGRGLNNLGTDSQRAAAPRRLDAADATVGKRRAVGAEHQSLHPVVKVRYAGGWEIGLADLLVHQRQLGLAYRGKHRAYTGFVHVNTHGQIDLVRIRICTAGSGKTKYGIVGKAWEQIKHGRSS